MLLEVHFLKQMRKKKKKGLSKEEIKKQLLDLMIIYEVIKI